MTKIKEIWKDIAGYETHYEISNHGRVKSKYAGRNKIIPPHKLRTGYFDAHLSLGGKLKYVLIHRLVAKAFIPNPENKPCVNHIDADKSNNAIWNLEWVTHYENEMHSIANGLRTPFAGQNNPINKLNEKTIIEIRNEHVIQKRGDPVRIGKIYGVHANTIRDIIRRKTWTHI